MAAKQQNNWPKHLLQWGVLAAIVLVLSGIVSLGEEKADPEAWCPMGGLQALATFLANSTLPCSMSSVQVMMGIALAAAAILFAKLFCGYLCPIGTVEDFLSGLRKGFGWKKGLSIRNGSITDKVLRIFKYVLLFVVFYSTVTASELFCKNFDPYYAVATGFKGEITLWMSILSIVVAVLGGFFVDRFWCRYICPLGAASNSLKYWWWLVILFGVVAVLGLCGADVNWVIVLAVFCAAGYLLEVLLPDATLQTVAVIRNESLCNSCTMCTRHCPYHIPVDRCDGRVTNVDCTLCGECTAACRTGALNVGVSRKAGGGFWKYVPALLTVALAAFGIWGGTRFELPTINMRWGIDRTDSTGAVIGQLVPAENLETVKLDGLRSVKCYGSSMAFKARLERIRGVHGVKTFVHHHKADVLIDKTVLDEEKLMEAIFTPSMFRIWTPDPAKLDSLKIVTIRTEKMYDKVDLNYLGLQFRGTGKSIFGLESEFACPLIIRVYMSPDETVDEQWFKEIVELKMLRMPVHGGGTKDTPVDYKFVSLEPGYEMTGISDYLHKMFDNTSAFTAEFPTRVAKYEGKPQFVYEIPDRNYEKPVIKRSIPYLSNHLSRNEGVIGVYIRLNRDLVPAIQIRYAAPMTEDRIWELINEETWTVTYSADDVREIPAKMKFKDKGVVSRAENSD